MTDETRLIDELLAKAGATDFGSLDVVTRDALRSASRRYYEGGRENVTQDEMMLLLGNKFTGAVVAAMCEASAEADPKYHALLALTGQRSLSTMRAERDKLAAELAELEARPVTTG